MSRRHAASHRVTPASAARLRLRGAAIGLGLLALGVVQAPAASAQEVFRAGGVAGLLTLPAAAQVPRGLPAVLIVHDAPGIDRRSHRYAVQLEAAGFVTAEIELAPNSPDGALTPLPDEAEAAALVSVAADALALDPRIDPRYIGALGFGFGARALALASWRPQGRVMLMAQVLLYPGCARLHEALEGLAPAPSATAMPTLLMHGDADPANTPADCRLVADALSGTGQVQRIAYRLAAYGWDLPTVGDSDTTRYRLEDRSIVTARYWPALAELSAAQVASFLCNALRACGP